MKEESKLLLLKKDCTYDANTKNFNFELSDGNHLLTKKILYIANPQNRIIFKILFADKDGEKRLKDLLNAFLYPKEDENKIQNLSIITKEYRNENKKMERNFILADVICKIEINNEDSFVAVELKINIEPTINENALEFDSSESFISNYSYDYSLLISILSQKDYHDINSEETRKNEINTLDYMKTIEINLYKEYEKLKKGEKIIINGKELDIEGKEFIKLFCLENWAKNSGNKYIIPNMDLSKNETINECIDILSSFNEFDLIKIKRSEEDFIDFLNSKYEEGYREGFKEGQIRSVFSTFSSNQNFDLVYKLLIRLKIQIKNEEEIRTILKDKEINLVDSFIDNLKKYKLL